MSRVIIFQILAALAGGFIARNKGRNYILWALLCFVFPLLVFVIFILPARVVQGKTKRCPYCSGIIHQDDPACRHCKKELPINLVQCKECGSFVPDKEFCMQCNRVMRKE